MGESLLTEKRVNDVLVVSLNRAGSLNALNVELMREVESFARRMIDDPARVLVFSGIGKHFSAGADLKAARKAQVARVQARRDAQLGGRMLKAIVDIPQVTIAAVQGVALGGGLCIPTACDFRIAADNAIAGYPEVNLGMNLMWQSVGLCQRLIGPARAKRLIMLGEHLDAQTLLDLGLVGRGSTPCRFNGSSFGACRSLRRSAADRSTNDQADHQPVGWGARCGDPSYGCRPKSVYGNHG